MKARRWKLLPRGGSDYSETDAVSTNTAPVRRASRQGPNSTCRKVPRTQLPFQSAQNQSQLAEVMIVECLLSLGRIF